MQLNSWPTGAAGSEGKQLAASLAQRWLLTMFTSWSSPGRLYHKMVEKWDATAIGKSGGGGEYSVQTGELTV